MPVNPELPLVGATHIYTPISCAKILTLTRRKSNSAPQGVHKYILVEAAPREQLGILSCVNKRANPWPKTTHSMASHPGDAKEIGAHCPRTISSLTSGLRTNARFCMNQSPSPPKAPALARAKAPTCPKLRHRPEPKLRPAQRSGLGKNQSSYQTRAPDQSLLAESN